jgi:hypothetical protein
MMRLLRWLESLPSPALCRLHSVTRQGLFLHGGNELQRATEAADGQGVAKADLAGGRISPAYFACEVLGVWRGLNSRDSFCASAI